MLEKMHAWWQDVKQKMVSWDLESRIKQVFTYCRWFNIQLTTAFGITTIVHWSVLLTLILMLLFSPFQATIFFIALMSIVPHEYGHALAAKYYGVKTRRIVVYPVGGIAMLEVNKKIKMREWKEFVITACGPLVTLALAVLGLVMTLWHGVPEHRPLPPEHMGFWFYLFVVNTGLFLFNLIPAFPMDGGRILRSILSRWFDHLTSTKYAFYSSVFCCWTLMGLGVLYGRFNLVIVMLLILQMARMEYRMAQQEAALEAGEQVKEPEGLLVEAAKISNGK